MDDIGGDDIPGVRALGPDIGNDVATTEPYFCAALISSRAAGPVSGS